MALAVAAFSILLSDQWGVDGLIGAGYQVKDVLAVVAPALGIVAFLVVALGLLSAARPVRMRALAVGAWLFVGYGLADGTGSILQIVVQPRLGPWKFTVAEAGQAAGGFAIAAGAAVAAVAFIAGRERLLSRAAAMLAAAYGFYCVAYSFFLAGFTSIGFSPPARVTSGLGLVAGGAFLAALGAIVAAVTLSVGVAPLSDLGAGAFVFAAGLVVVAIGFLILATSGGSGASAWLDGFSWLVLAVAAGTAGVAFAYGSGPSEQGDGADLAVLADPA